MEENNELTREVNDSARVVEIWDSRNQKFIYYPEIKKTITYKFLFWNRKTIEWTRISRTSSEKRAKEILFEHDETIRNAPVVFGGAINIW